MNETIESYNRNAKQEHTILESLPFNLHTLQFYVKCKTKTTHKQNNTRGIYCTHGLRSYPPQDKTSHRLQNRPR